MGFWTLPIVRNYKYSENSIYYSRMYLSRILLSIPGAPEQILLHTGTRIYRLPASIVFPHLSPSRIYRLPASVVFPHLLSSRIHLVFSGSSTKTMNRSFTVLENTPF
jgi:hypothetical protein